ncbi:DNA polymerase beta superfamily protein [Desulfovibrio cuneatus]|uniref:DNA polymerase beta superfamily protein n=1 Tax=Desulfovibrio cuneatus TaxID=159728 RepID=UPI0012EB534A|nr:nucleotidyltransferase domain-containing protein [Desulfovibrio cuneatus]
MNASAPPLPPKLPGASQYLAQAHELCREHGATLLFLTLFGSSLYGTESPGKSDVDIRGIFLPSTTSLHLQEATKSLHYSTGNNARRNTAQDVDIDLWSVQHWLLQLLPAGDIGALDMLFAPSHPACTLYRSPALDAVFANPLKLTDTVSGRAYAEYSLGQAKQYGIKGSRVGALRRVGHWLAEQTGNLPAHAKLLPCIDVIAGLCDDSEHCFAVETRQGKGLHLCGKTHMGSIGMEEFARRVQGDMQRDGARALEAEHNNGIDFKALSHAVRALYQVEELLLTGKIVFPLQQREELRAIKEGHSTWSQLEPYILERLAQVDTLRRTAPHSGTYQPDFAKQCVLACYGHTPPPKL